MENKREKEKEKENEVEKEKEKDLRCIVHFDHIYCTCDGFACCT